MIKNRKYIHSIYWKDLWIRGPVLVQGQVNKQMVMTVRVAGCLSLGSCVVGKSSLWGPWVWTHRPAPPRGRGARNGLLDLQLLVWKGRGCSGSGVPCPSRPKTDGGWVLDSRAGAWPRMPPIPSAETSWCGPGSVLSIPAPQPPLCLRTRQRTVPKFLFVLS